MVATAAAAVLPTASCSLSEDQWTEQAPTISCKLLRRCDPINFYRDFADLDSCVAATDLGEIQECDFDAARAAECQEALSWSCRKVGRNYKEVVDRCSDIWTCDTGFVVPGGPGLIP